MGLRISRRPFLCSSHLTLINIHARTTEMITYKISLRNSFPSHWGSTRIISGVLPVLALINKLKISVLVNIHQSRTTASKIDTIQKKIRKRTLAVQLCASSLPTRTRDSHPLEPAHGGQTAKKHPGTICPEV